MSIHDFLVTGIHGKEIQLSDFRGKTLLIVSTATQCSLTPQYDELEALYQKYKDKGLVILDFPSNEFGQAVEDNEEIAKFLAEHYQVSFPVFAKIDINGSNTHPLYRHLKSQDKAAIGNSRYEVLLEVIAEINQTRTGDDIKWNFTKFLVDADGNVVARFAPTIGAKEMEHIIQQELVDAA